MDYFGVKTWEDLLFNEFLSNEIEWLPDKLPFDDNNGINASNGDR